MYESFYGLSGPPFSLLPDAGFLFMSRRHRRAVNLLDYGIAAQAGFIVMTGEVGAGKTTLIRRYLKNAGADVAVGVITNASPASGCLLDWVAMAYGFENEGLEGIRLHARFVDFLVKQYGSGKRAVLIVDEAQNLTPAMLEDLRMLSNVNNEKDQMLQIILVGQPELLETLKRPDLRQFVQRISAHCHIDPMTAAETAAYIRHRLGVVGGAADLFDDDACAAVHYFTGGVPRLINLLCDQAMLYAFSDDRPRIGSDLVVEVAADHGRAGLSAFRAPPALSRAGIKGELRPILDAMREEAA
ncbi:MAG: AAA family ATPase [Alphaproteobacteria bacterium]|nr:AAA family ATPase [Alphaproteobacteria bacterium]